jgi:hypothetical protein
MEVRLPVLGHVMVEYCIPATFDSRVEVRWKASVPLVAEELEIML